MKKLLNFLLPTKFKPRHKITNVELQAFRKLFQMDINQKIKRRRIDSTAFLF